MRQFRFVKSCLLLLLALFVSVGTANADNECFEHDYNFIAFGTTDRVVHVRVLAFSSGGYNHWAGKGSQMNDVSRGLVKFHVIENNQLKINVDKKKGTSEYVYQDGLYEFFRYNAKNFDIKGNVTLPSLTCTLGTIRWTDPLTKQIITLEEGRSTGDIVMQKEKIEDNRDAYFLEFDWIHPDYIQVGNEKKSMEMFAVEFNIYDERSNDHWIRKYTVPSISTESTLVTPEFVAPMYDIRPENTEIGAVMAGLVGSGTIKGYTIYNNGNKLLENNLPTGGEYIALCNLPQSDSVRTLSADVMFADPAFNEQNKDNKVTRLLHTKTPLTLQPIHSIVPKGMKENNTNPLNEGYNTLTWAFNNPDEKDFLSTDAFSISRGYKPDFSDQETIGSASITKFESFEKMPTSSQKDNPENEIKNVLGYFKYEDNTPGATYNRYGTHAYDKGKKYNVTGLTTEACLDEFVEGDVANARTVIEKYLEIPVRKVYYTIERMFVKQSLRGDYSNKANRDKFCYRDSVYKNTQLPHVTNVTVEKTVNWQFDHKVKVRVRLDNYFLRDIFNLGDIKSPSKGFKDGIDRFVNAAENNGFKSRLYTWDDRAKIKLTRYDIAAMSPDEIKTVEYVINGNDVQLSEDSTYYYAEFEDTMDKPFTNYKYGASVDESRSIYPIINNNECKTLNPDDEFYYDERAVASTVTASKGYYNDQIFVKWAKIEGQRTRIKLYRRSLDNPGSQYEEVADVSDNTTFYRDTKGVAGGKWFMYKLEVSLSYKDKIFTSSDSVAGSTSIYGSVSGAIRLKNGGSAMSGVTVTATRLSGNDSIPQRALALPITELLDKQKFLAMSTQENLPLNKTYSLQFWTKAKGVQYKDVNGQIYDVSPTHNSIIVGGDTIFIDGKGKVFLNDNAVPRSALELEKYPSAEYVCYTLNRNLEDDSFTVYIDTTKLGTIKVPAKVKPEKGMPMTIASNWHIDDMRVFNRQLTKDEIGAFTTRILSGHEQGLAAYYHFDENPLYCQGVASDAAYKTESDATRYDLHLYSNGELVTDNSVLEQISDNKDIFDAASLAKIVVTGSDGKYIINGLSTNEGVRYTIVPTAGGTSDFEYTKTSEPQATLEFSPTRNSYVGTDFEFMSTVRFTGRVLYKNTTVPVRDAFFKINGKDVVSVNGAVIRTDQSGAFAFDVPRITMTFQVVKDGHVFQNNGFVYKNGGTEKDSLFTPAEDYIGLELWDNTKVRVAGRIVGGTTQASKPLGMAQSVNNLGDDITMVMALEGDNTSNLLYIQGEEDVKSKTETLVVNAAEDWWDPTRKENPYAITTKSVMERQRLTIYPDVNTGEFYVDLLPVRYKITQLYANGYSTLFGSGETAQVLDLTNAHSTVLKDTVAIWHDGREQTLRTTYNHTYTRTYHSPVSVSYKQLTYGVEDIYFGEEKLKSMDKYGIESQIKVVEIDNQAKTCNYVFGMPVFQQEYPYAFSVYAHEDFYYNNDSIQGRHEQVMTPRCKVVVNNGLKDKDNSEEVMLDDNGMAIVNFTAGTPTFGTTDEAAVRTITFDVLVDGKYYSSSPLKCLLIGNRLKEGSVTTYPMADTRVVDVLRDPPGSTSYSYIDEGATYNLGRKYNITATLKLNFNWTDGPGKKLILGTVNLQSGIMAGQMISTSSLSEGISLPLPLGTILKSRDASYVLTLNNRIQTSADPADVGAMADVYVGTTTNLIVGLVESYCVVDEDVFAQLKPSIESGDSKLVTKGVNKDGKAYYMVTGNKAASTMSNPVTFVYSQKHIVNNIIPQLRSKRNSLLINGTVEEVKRMANATGKIYYVTDSIYGVHKGFGKDGTYQMILPEGFNGVAHDEVAACNEQIRKWIYIVETNELWKLQALAAGKQYKSYSLSGNIPVSHNETTSYNDSGMSTVVSVMGVPVNVGAAAAANAAAMSLPSLGLPYLNNLILKTFITKKQNEEKHKDYTYADLKNEVETQAATLGGEKNQVAVSTGGQEVYWEVYPTVENWNYANDMSLSAQENRSSGYYLAADGDSYMDVVVYRTPADSVATTAKITSTLTWITDSTKTQDALKDLTACDYVFDVKGGASRPWYEPDTTIFYNPGTPLSGKTLKIDNPRLNIPQAIISNIPQDEKAVFTLNMTNDSELPAGQQLSGASSFTLAIDDTSNPDGVKISMDGEPLTSGRTFVIAPHQTLTKTIELTRGRKYDYEDIRLVLSSADGHLMDTKTIAVHYMPTSSPVHIASPTNHWTLNTNASQDSIGYYMPVIVDGFDVTYQGFDHIEIQYKPSTKGDDSWVNLCSYYASDSLFQAATGNKAMITSGIINDFRFYGERDPMEMNYDLRAVCFSRMGTDFVTRSSEIMTGTKDTRKPRIIGMPDPKNGIVDYGEHITFSFTEPIAYNYLDQTSNFDVLGFINDNTEINNSSSLSFPGKAEQMAETTVERNIRQCDFSVDMLMSTQEGNRKQVLLSHGASWNRLTFGLTEKNQLYLQMNGETFVGNEHNAAEINGAMVHVGATYNDSTRTARLFFGNAFEKDAKGNPLQFTFKDHYSVSGKVRLGYDMNSAEDSSFFAGKLLETRLWKSELTAEEVSNYNQKIVSGYNNRMIAHWPLNQTVGNIATDEVSGAHLTLNSTKWNTRQGFSLPLNKKEVALAADYFTRSNLSDYTLGFWFKSQMPRIAETDTVSIFSIGANDTLPEARIMRLQFVGDKLKYRSGQKFFDLGATYNDGDWHHFSVSVNRSKNQAILMMDGVLKSQLAADDVNGLASDYAAMGDTAFVGRIDEISLFNRSTNTTYASLFYNSVPDLTSPELKIYLPFSQMSKSSQGLIEEVYSPYNTVSPKNATSGVLLVTDEATRGDKEDWAPVRESERLSKLEFDWSSNGTDLFLHLLTPTNKINKQNVFINIRDVQDVNGNTMADAQSYAMFMDCNQLVWNEKYMKTGLNLGEGDVLTASFTNKGSTACHFNMTTNVDWISLAYDDGSIEPNSVLENYIGIKAGLDPGVYIGLITLTDENGLADNMEVYVTVLAEEPTWEIDKRYNLTASLIGEVHIVSDYYDVTDNNPLDIVGAFNSKGDCVGKSYISTNEMGQGMVFLTIYGDDEMNLNKDSITFRLWRSDKGMAPVLAADQDIHFTSNAVFGSVTPVRLSTSDQIWQTLSLQKGWNWVSLNVAPDSASTLNNVFADKGMFSEADEIREGLHISMFTNGTWPMKDSLLLKSVTNGKVYQIKVAKAGNYSVLGSRLTDAQKVVRLEGGNKWQQLPYPLDVTLSVRDAMADYQSGDTATVGYKGTVGDIIKNYNEFAILSADNTWVGSLQYFTPGVGYYIQRGAKSDSCTIDFSKIAKASSYPELRTMSKARSVSCNSMPVVAMFDAENPDVLPTDKLVAIVGGEKVAEASPVVTENANLYFLNLNEAEGQRIEFAQERDGELINISTGLVSMSAESVVGSLDSPYVVSFTDDVAEINYYNIQGHKIQSPVYGVNIVEVVHKDGSKRSFKLYKNR